MTRGSICGNYDKVLASAVNQRNRLVWIGHESSHNRASAAGDDVRLVFAGSDQGVGGVAAKKRTRVGNGSRGRQVFICGITIIGLKGLSAN
jgi:hypothetical protein